MPLVRSSGAHLIGMKVFCMINGLGRWGSFGSWDLGWGQGQGRGDHGVTTFALRESLWKGNCVLMNCWGCRRPCCGVTDKLLKGKYLANVLSNFQCAYFCLKHGPVSEAPLTLLFQSRDLALIFRHAACVKVTEVESGESFVLLLIHQRRK